MRPNRRMQTRYGGWGKFFHGFFWRSAGLVNRRDLAMFCPMISFDQLERRFGWLSFPGFLRFYVLMHALVYVLQIVRPDIGFILDFDRDKILTGEVWRIVTFLFSSSGFSGVGVMGAVFFYFMVMIAFMMSDALESAWGVFKTSLFYYCGIACLVVANFVLPVSVPGSGFLLYGSAFFAFATLFPRVEFLIFFILPVQVRFLAMIQAVGLLLGVFSAWIMLPYFLLAYANYIFWAGIPALRGTARIIEATQRRKRFNSAKTQQEDSFHSCVSCDRTEVTDPGLEFRVGSDGREYCADHIEK